MQVEIHRHSPQTPWTYAHLDARQREIASEVRAGREGGLLLSEVAPVITLGKRAEHAQGGLLLSKAEYEVGGIEILKTDRGGLATYHGPGQWVLFAVETLEALTGDPRGVRKAVEALLQGATQAAKDYVDDVEVVREGPRLGVWSSVGKIASVGVQVEKRILLHGLSINGFKTPQSFRGLRPCGLEAPVDFLLDSADEAPFVALGQKIIGCVKEAFLKAKNG